MHNQNEKLTKKTQFKRAVELMPKDERATAILQKRADELKTIKKSSHDISDIVSYIKFKLGKDELYGVPFSAANEVIRNANITAVPFTPDYISGVINHRGLLLTVINLKNYLQISDDDNKHVGREIIIISTDNFLLGLQVRYIEGSDAYYTSQLDAISMNSKSIKSDHIIGIDKGKITILNIHSMLTDIKRQLKNSMLRR